MKRIGASKSQTIKLSGEYGHTGFSETRDYYEFMVEDQKGQRYQIRVYQPYALDY